MKDKLRATLLSEAISYNYNLSQVKFSINYVSESAFFRVSSSP